MSGITSPPESWLEQLQPASWRGIPFAVRSSEYPRGRRFALHEYPYRDTPWAEDVGRASRYTRFSGFVVGDNCFQQAQALVAAAEMRGPGQLVHPSLGTLTVALIEPLVPAERWDLGRVVELQFSFVETGSPTYPDTSGSTQASVGMAASKAAAASSSDFAKATGQATPAPTTTKPPAGLQAAPTGTYTDEKGSVTLVPAPTNQTTYQDSDGASTVSLFGASASQQASDPGLVAGATDGLQPPQGYTYSRYTLGNLSTDSAPPASVDSALSNQVSGTAAVGQAGQAAAATVGS